MSLRPFHILTLLCGSLLTIVLGGCVAAPPALSGAAAAPTAPAPTATVVLSTRTATVSLLHTFELHVAPTPSLPPTAPSVPTPPATATATPAPSVTPNATARRQQIFEEVWQTINEHYLYADFRGLDWQAVWHEFAPRVARARSDEALYQLMIEMVSRLNDNHSRFLPPSAAVAETMLSAGHEAYVGIGVITVPSPEGAIIQQVLAGSPAASAGLQPQDRIVAVDGEPFTPGRELSGAEGSSVRLVVVRSDEQAREVVLTRARVEGQIIPTVRRLEGDIGYINVPTLWVHNMDDLVSGALTDLVVESELNGLILDLRGNPGGWRDVLTSVLGHFVRGEVGSFFNHSRTHTLLIRESSGPDLRGLPLVVLIDGATSSYAEVIAAVLQAEAQALIVGAPSAGNTETIYAYELANGARLWVAQEGFRLRNGHNLEGSGVQPDHDIDTEHPPANTNEDASIQAGLRHFGVLAGQ